ncbi:MAG: gamma-glutamyl-gamma-aminobutyrate hydrolase family protein [Acidobacteria bacterium]|nr:gamma-glutamyl-gamma-aminobutyrate hydrolase family protein [Acidobacteriota bacterium]
MAIIGISKAERVEDYVASVRRAGGEVRLLDPGTDDPARVVAEIDGLLLPGGGDVHPKYYGGAMTPAIQLAEPGRDEFEIALAEQALEHDVPILAICRGLQVLNVAAKGTLLPHVPDAVGTTVAHAVDESKTATAHDVRVTPGSALARALEGRITALETCAVNSRHHQAVGHVAPGFSVSATAPDGIVEAIERPDRRFCLGVEWHPENFWRTGEFRGLFEEFVKAARDHRSSA